jgi:hypothetical protein
MEITRFPLTLFVMRGRQDAQHTYHSDLCKPRLELKQGGTYIMDVIAARKILHILPISAKTQTNHRTVLFHLPNPYEPPTYCTNCTTLTLTGISCSVSFDKYSLYIDQTSLHQSMVLPLPTFSII